MKEKVWYIKIDDREEGPYSFLDLRGDSRVTPDTLARKVNNPMWRPIRQIAELKRLFYEENPDEVEDDGVKKIKPQDELVLEMNKDPKYLFWALMLIILLSAYLIYISR